MQSVCLTDDSYGLSRLIFSETYPLKHMYHTQMRIVHYLQPDRKIKDNAVISLRPFVDFEQANYFAQRCHTCISSYVSRDFSPYNIGNEEGVGY